MDLVKEVEEATNTLCTAVEVIATEDADSQVPCQSLDQQHPSSIDPLPTSLTLQPSIESTLVELAPIENGKSRKRKQSVPQQVRQGEGEEPTSVKKGGTSEEPTKMLPIHCEIELCQMPNGESHDSQDKIKDGYAIVPSNLKLQDLIHTALTKLDYEASLAKFSEGLILIRNWKPLPFNTITEQRDATVGDLFSDLLSHLTLRIKVGGRHAAEYIPNEWNDAAVRYTVTNLLKHMTQSHLARISPLPQSMISNIANKKYNSSISTEKCLAFGEWFQVWCLNEQNRIIGTQIDIDLEEHCTRYTPKARVTFCQTHEAPLLREWYRNYPNPTSDQWGEFCTILNNLPIRESKGIPVTIKNIKGWWRNERVKERTAFPQMQSSSQQMDWESGAENIGQPSGFRALLSSNMENINI